MIQQQTFRNIPATIAVSANNTVAFKYEHTKHLIENDGSAVWSSEKLTLNGVDYKCGMWHTLNEELKQYLNSYMNY